jgi:hypothetical protein
MKKTRLMAGLGVGVVALTTAGLAAASGGFSFGVFRDGKLADMSSQLYGVGQPIATSSSRQLTKAQALADPTKLATLAGGLTAKVVTTQGAPVVDQISLWPNAAHPTTLIACNEEDPTEPGLERIDLATGKVATIVTGTEDCDPTRLTPWGTIVFGEEDGGGPNGGRIYELIDPLHTTNVKLDRTTGVFSGGTGAKNLVTRTALGHAAFEGLGILKDGTSYLDFDDSGLGPKDGKPGDFYLKFLPAHPFTGTTPITQLSQSPYASGQMYALRVGLGTDYGQGREFGLAQWIKLPPTADPDLEAQGSAAGVTGYYRPEDADIDPIALAKGQVRVCSNDTGDETNHLYGQTVCLTDGTVAQAMANTGTPEIQPFVLGGTSRGINMPDNIAFQAGRGNAVIHEDAETTFEFPHNNDLWDCLPDGADQDLLSDGCVRIGTLNDLTAEWTGGTFDASGKHFFVSVQHNISGKATILEIDGWK